MDPLTQGVLGASLPQACAKGRYGASAGLLGFLAGMSADLDEPIRYCFSNTTGSFLTPWFLSPLAACSARCCCTH